MRLPFAVLLSATFVVLAIADPGPGGTAEALAPIEPRAAKSAGLESFRNCRGLAGYLSRHEGRGGYPFLPIAEDNAGGGESTPSPAAPTSPTGTNVQEAGIDEPDIVKSAPSAILALSEGSLHAVVTGPGGPQLAGSLKLTEDGPSAPGDVVGRDLTFSGGPSSLLVHGDRALVIGYGWGAAGPMTTLIEIDTSDPAALRVLSESELEGSFVSGRQTGPTARLVVSAYPDYAELEEHGAASRRWLPSIRTAEGGEIEKRRLTGCRAVDHSSRYSGSGMLTVLTVDLSAGSEIVDSDAILTSGDTLYASDDRLYVATQRWSWGDGSVTRASDVNTQIHAFATDQPNATGYVASGRVPGWMLSQWSMSERDGYLRVASTTSPPWTEGEPEGKSESFVTVLREDGQALSEAGSLGGLGVGEQIYAVRFFDDVGYVVTFRQVDPLYTIDLSDPAGPKLLGELKIPGYSAYLHPVGEGLLLGVGQDADSEGVTQGAQLSLFDVSDLTSPQRIATHSLGRNAYTEVEYDHHAFFFDSGSGLSITPFSDRQGDEGSYGAAAVRISPSGLSEVATVRHGAGWRSLPNRALLRDGSVYTVSAKGVMAHDRNSLAQTGFAELPVP